MFRNSCLYKHNPKTFRRGSSKIMDYWGSNMQNWEKSLREIYRPDGFSPALQEKCLEWLKTGETAFFTEQELVTLRVFIQSDQSGAEALIVAYECDALDYRQLFIHGVKPHVYVALKLFKHIWTKKLKESGGLIEDFNIDELCDTKISELKKNPFWKDIDKLIKSSDNWSARERYYYLAKQTCHSANYGIEENTFRMNVLEKSEGIIYLSKEEASNFLMTYRGLFPEIPERCRRIEQQAIKTKMLYNMFGFPFHITDYNIDSKMKEYFAWSAQSTVGEITRIAATQLQQYIESENKRWDLLADTHDSYMLQCPLLDAKEARDKMKELMNIRLVSPNDGTHFNMKSEQNLGFNWNSKKSDEVNPLGLQELSWM
jgi:DNA polymerase family A